MDYMCYGIHLLITIHCAKHKMLILVNS